MREDRTIHRELITEADELNAVYSAEYLRDCADGEARQERLAELRRRIEAQAYNVDAARIAEELLLRRDLGEDGEGGD